MTSPETDGTRQGERSAARRAEQDSSWFDRALVPPTPVVPDPAAGQSDASAPDGAAPAGAVPAGAVPVGGAPVGAAPVGAAPVGTLPPVAPAVEDDDFLDENWTAPRRTNRLTALLAVGIVAAAGFAGGAWVQRSHDAGLTSAAGALGGAGRTGGQFPGGFPSGGFPSGGFPSGGFGGAGQVGGNAAGGGTAGGAGGTGGTDGTGGTGGAGSATSTGVPVVVGTVASVEGTTVTVKNFGGQSVVVRVSDTTTVTSVGLGGLKPGATVAVFGTKAADGSVTATSIVSRKAG